VARATQGAQEEELAPNPRAMPGDRIRARGVPIIGRVGGAGAIPGSEPLPATLRKLGDG